MLVRNGLNVETLCTYTLPKSRPMAPTRTPSPEAPTNTNTSVTQTQTPPLHKHPNYTNTPITLYL